MKILVVGSGGREHALAWKLSQSPGLSRLFCAPGNAGTETIAENVDVAANDLNGLLAFAKENAIGLTVVGPDDALAAGIVDLFESEGLRIFGPTKSAARLESSKIFAKELMREQGIPTAAAGTFDRARDAHDFCAQAAFPLVIKADGLALGKGVMIAQTLDDAAEAIEEMMTRGRFRDAGRRLVIEEYLRGRECSLHALVSGSRYQMLASARDHKRAYDGDQGPNTGGMGAVSPAENWTPELQAGFDRDVMEPLLTALRERGVEFRGLLFPGLMLTADGPRVLEFNCRFGDPETQAILPRLKSDLLELLNATIDGELDRVKIQWDERAGVTVILASGGYPDKYETGKKISGLDAAAALENVQIFHAGTRRQDSDVVTAGGRVLSVTALGTTIAEARRQAYAAVAKIGFEGCQFRRDIALT